MKVLAVIPARYGSTRLPGKPLALIQGKPMIQWVYQSVSKARGIDETVVATDDPRIVDAVESIGGKAVMTLDCVSGSDRVAQVAEKSDADIIINIQGDEPLIEPRVIEAALELVKSGRFEMASAMTKIEAEREMTDPSVVKAIVDKNDAAIYFSRFPIPYSRAQAENENYCAYRHLGLYVYTRDVLLTLTRLPASPLEKGESLEQLRALENGIRIGLARVQSRTFGIDTPEDLSRANAIATTSN